MTRWRWAGLWAVTWTWAAAAHAQEASDVPIDLDMFRPSVDAHAAFAVDGTLSRSASSASVTAGYANNLGSFCELETATCRSLISHLGGLYLTGRTQHDWFSVGGAAALHPLAVGELQPSGQSTVAGDGMLEVRVTPLAVRGLEDGLRPGLAVAARLGVPFGGHHAFLGRRGVTGEFTAIADLLLGPLWLSVNGGVRLGQRGVAGGEEADGPSDLVVNDHGLVSAAVGWVPTWGGITAEINSRLDLGPWTRPELPSESAAGRCRRPARSLAEARLGAFVHASPVVSVRAGVGRGLTCSLGAAAVRAELGLTFQTP